MFGQVLCFNVCQQLLLVLLSFCVSTQVSEPDLACDRIFGQSVWDSEPVELGHLIVRQTAICMRRSLYVTTTCRTKTLRSSSNRLLSQPQEQLFTCMEHLEARKKGKRQSTAWVCQLALTDCQITKYEIHHRDSIVVILFEDITLFHEVCCAAM